MVFREIHQLRGCSFFGKCLKFNLDFENAKKKQKKNLRKVFFLDIIASKLVALNCPYKADNACYQQSMREETVLLFCL